MIPLTKEEKVSDWLEREKDLHIEIHVVWKRGFAKDGRQEDLYDDWLKAQSINTMTPETQEVAVAVQTSKTNPHLTL